MGAGIGILAGGLNIGGGPPGLGLTMAGPPMRGGGIPLLGAIGTLYYYCVAGAGLSLF